MTPEYITGTKCNYEHNRLKPFRHDTQAIGIILKLAKHYRTLWLTVSKYNGIFILQVEASL